VATHPFLSGSHTQHRACTERGSFARAVVSISALRMLEGPSISQMIESIPIWKREMRPCWQRPNSSIPRAGPESSKGSEYRQPASLDWTAAEEQPQILRRFAPQDDNVDLCRSTGQTGSSPARARAAVADGVRDCLHNISTAQVLTENKEVVRPQRPGKAVKARQHGP
jgi:hypothetical protein